MTCSPLSVQTRASLAEIAPSAWRRRGPGRYGGMVVMVAWSSWWPGAPSAVTSATAVRAEGSSTMVLLPMNAATTLGKAYQPAGQCVPVTGYLQGSNGRPATFCAMNAAVFPKPGSRSLFTTRIEVSAAPLVRSITDADWA